MYKCDLNNKVSMKRRATLYALAFASLALATPARTVAANAIQLENQKTGTMAWQIGLPPYQNSNDTDMWIRGYASAVSINKGAKITFNITVNPYRWKAMPVSYYIDVYRVGWYSGAGGRLMKHLGPFNGVQQLGGTSSGGVTSPGCPYDADTGMIACQWTGDGLGNGSYTLDTSQPTVNGTADWTSGIYLALLTTNQMQYGPEIDPDHQTYIIFTIREDARQSDILFQQAVATYQAYNNFPDDRATGKSLCDNQSYGALTSLGTQRAVKVSFDRPYTYSDHTGAGDFLKWELHFIRLIERNAYAEIYTTDVDTHANGTLLRKHKTVVTAGHSEYWSSEMRNALESARDYGTSFGFFGASTMYSQIRFEPSPVTGAPNRVVVAYKDASLDPVNNPDYMLFNPALTTVPWRNGPVYRPEQQTIGIMYDNYFDGESPAQAYVIHNSANWVYADTGFVNGTRVPGILGYDVDSQFPSYPLPSAVAGTSVLLSNSPFISQINRPGVGNSSIYQAINGPGAWVLGAGTIYWSLGLDGYIPPAGIRAGSGSRPNVGIQQTTANFLNRTTGRLPNLTRLTVSVPRTGKYRVNLSWVNNSLLQTSVIIERSTDGMGFAQIGTAPGTDTSFHDTTAVATTSYYYRVAASSAAETSAYSNVATTGPRPGCSPRPDCDGRLEP